jgi:hypothetical protein
MINQELARLLIACDAPGANVTVYKNPPDVDEQDERITYRITGVHQYGTQTVIEVEAE